MVGYVRLLYLLLLYSFVVLVLFVVVGFIIVDWIVMIDGNESSSIFSTTTIYRCLCVVAVGVGGS